MCVFARASIYVQSCRKFNRAFTARITTASRLCARRTCERDGGRRLLLSLSFGCTVVFSEKCVGEVGEFSGVYGLFVEFLFK